MINIFLNFLKFFTTIYYPIGIYSQIRKLKILKTDAGISRYNYSIMYTSYLFELSLLFSKFKNLNYKNNFYFNKNTYFFIVFFNLFLNFSLILSKTYYSQNFYLQSQHNYYLIAISIFSFIILIPLISNGIFIVTFLVYSLKFIFDIIKFIPQIYEIIIHKKSKSLSYNFVIINLIGTFLKLAFLINESNTSHIILLFLETILNTGLLSIMINYDYPNQIKYYKDRIYNAIQTKVSKIKLYITNFSEIDENNEIEEMSLIESDKSEEFEHDFEIV
jgi:hypothetical protein